MADTTHIAAIIQLLTSRDEFTKPADQLDLTKQVEAYASIHAVEEAAKTRREALREELLKAAEKGTLTEKGGYKLPVGDHTVMKERRVASSPDEKKLMALIAKKGMGIEQAFDKVTVLQPNPSKVAALVEHGHLTEEEARDLYKATFALIVHAGGELEALLENAVPALPKKRR